MQIVVLIQFINCVFYFWFATTLRFSLHFIVNVEMKYNFLYWINQESIIQLNKISWQMPIDSDAGRGFK